VNSKNLPPGNAGERPFSQIELRIISLARRRETRQTLRNYLGG
jgi:hypothetical protein